MSFTVGCSMYYLSLGMKGEYDDYTKCNLEYATRLVSISCRSAFNVPPNLIEAVNDDALYAIKLLILE